MDKAAKDELRSEIDALLDDFYTPEEKVRWWDSPHPMFDGETAAKMLCDGRGAELVRSLQMLNDGAYL